MRQRYYHIKHYMKKLESLMKNKRSFELTKTSYTKKITTDNEVMFFNEVGDDDKKQTRCYG